MENMTLQTVERALMVLEIISIQPKSQKELEQATGFNRSNVRRLVFTLMNKGYIEKDSSGKYTLGLKVVELSSIRLNQVELKTEAAPLLRELSLKTNQVCHMGIYSEGEVVYIEKIQPVNSISMYSSIGVRIPVYLSSMGKVLLSQFDDEEIKRILKSTNMEKRTKNTHTDVGAVLDEVRIVRKNGYAVDNEENEDNIFCIGAPVYDYRKKIIAAISTTGNNRDYLRIDSGIITLVKNTADEISKRIGYTK
ncbi:MAG: IclR family transcriptional regulator [Clostridia bacterium]|nr:IclR family transcriptional regulator [Clostridia bacterium]